MTQAADHTVARGTLVAAVAWFCLLALLAGLTGWLFTSEIVSLPDSADPNAVDYLLVGRPVSHLVAWVLFALVLLVAWQAIGARRMFGLSAWQEAFAWQHTAALAPLLLLALPAASLAMAATPLARAAPPWIHLFIDRRWWFLAGIGALLANAISSRRAAVPRPGRLRILPSSSPYELLLIAVLFGAALVFAPPNRFDSVLAGDEPRYARYLENWYRGRGTDITNLTPVDALPVDYQPQVLRNLSHLGNALAAAATDLADDARRIAGFSAPPAPGPASSNGDAFVEGKRGGVYQVHNPGLPALLFPAYFVDRFALTWTSHPNAQIPARLYATNVALLCLYVLWGAALFRLLAFHTDDPRLSFSVAVVAMLSLPATAFAYQYYPEAAGGLVLAVVGRYVIAPAADGRWTAFGYGLLAGFLPWLHVRFGHATVVAAALMSVKSKTARPAIGAFWIGMVLPLAALCVYSYHITGSLIPFKVWSVMQAGDPTAQASNPAFARRLAGLWLDADWGLIAHAPVYLLAAAGLWPLWRRSRRMAALLSLVVGPLAIEAAWHNWHGSGTTPLRIVTAVVPLLAVPLADGVLHFKRSRFFLATFAALSAISIANGIAFNTHFDRAAPVLTGPTVSGWLSRLLFPHVDTSAWVTNPLVLFWLALTLALIAWPVLRPRGAGSRGTSWLRAVATVLVGIAAGSSIAGAWSGVPLRTRFLVPYTAARDAALRFRLDHPEGPLWSARHGVVALDGMFPNPPGVEIAVGKNAPVILVRDELAVTIEARGADDVSGWGTVTVDFGDGAAARTFPLVATAIARHNYDRQGEYTVTVTVALPGRERERRQEAVKVIPPNLIGPYGLERIPGLPSDVMELAVRTQIDRIAIDPSAMTLDCTAASRNDLPDGDHWVWVVGYEQGNLRARLHTARRAVSGGDPLRFALAISPAPGLDAGRPATAIVAVPRQGASARSRSAPLSFRWPGADLTVGSPVVVTAAESH